MGCSNLGKDTHNHLPDRRGVGRCPVAKAVAVVVLAEAVSGNVRFPWNLGVEGSHQGDDGKTFSLSEAGG